MLKGTDSGTDSNGGGGKRTGDREEKNRAAEAHRNIPTCFALSGFVLKERKGNNKAYSYVRKKTKPSVARSRFLSFFASSSASSHGRCVLYLSCVCERPTTPRIHPSTPAHAIHTDLTVINKPIHYANICTLITHARSCSLRCRSLFRSPPRTRAHKAAVGQENQTTGVIVII